MQFSIILSGILVLILRYLVGAVSNTSVILAVLLRLSFWTWSFENGKIATAAVVGAFLLGRSFLSNPQNDSSQQQDQPGSSLSSSHLKPLIFPCKTTHTRIFPKKHSFGYSYLQVGIPIGWHGNNSILGVKEHSRGKPWFSVSAEDYLARGQAHLGLEGKLRAYLASQGEDLNDYAHAYLLTAPRFLGYAFNPVSFWYLLSKDLRLDAMILEVNNTFDERRMYFMKRGIDFGDGNNEEPKFTHTWPKDFHVSPFNSRKGDYSLAAINPFATAGIVDPKVDNVITLKSSKGHAKIIARIFSTSPALDPDIMTVWTTFRLLSGWFWVGFVTFPRILKEAAKLFWQRGLHVWYRPEVLNTSVGRTNSHREKIIASAFLEFLKTQVADSNSISSIEYTPPNGTPLDTILIRKPDTSKKILSNPGTTQDQQHIKLQIYTPQFYTDIITAPSLASYISSTETQTPESHTFSTSSYTLLADLLRTKTFYSSTNTSTPSFYSPLAQIQTLLSTQQPGGQSSPFVDWALIHLTPDERKEFLQASIALLLANRCLAGFDVMIDIGQWALEGIFSWGVISLLIASL